MILFSIPLISGNPEECRLNGCQVSSGIDPRKPEVFDFSQRLLTPWRLGEFPNEFFNVIPLISFIILIQIAQVVGLSLTTLDETL